MVAAHVSMAADDVCKELVLKYYRQFGGQENSDTSEAYIFKYRQTVYYSIPELKSTSEEFEVLVYGSRAVVDNRKFSMYKDGKDTYLADHTSKNIIRLPTQKQKGGQNLLQNMSDLRNEIIKSLVLKSCNTSVNDKGDTIKDIVFVSKSKDAKYKELRVKFRNGNLIESLSILQNSSTYAAKIKTEILQFEKTDKSVLKPQAKNYVLSANGKPVDKYKAYKIKDIENKNLPHANH